MGEGKSGFCDERELLLYTDAEWGSSALYPQDPEAGGFICKAYRHWADGELLCDRDGCAEALLPAAAGNGELYRGCNYFAGAATFSLIDSKHDFDWQNTFGLIGGVGYLTRNYEKRFALERNSIDGLAFFNKANHNDIASLEILRDYTKNLARYIFNMQMLLDLENISIGGGISTQPLLLTMLKKEVSDLFDCIPVPVTPPEIKVCHYYNDANLIGAFCWYKKANF